MLDDNDKDPSFAFEQVAAKLVPFDLQYIGGGSIAGGAAANPAPATPLTTGEGVSRGRDGTITIDIQSTAGVDSSGFGMKRDNALWPIFMTGGLVFPYNPSISENVQVNYEAADITHSNESYHFYKNTSNVRLSLGNCVWTCDTFDNAIYALSALHFLRSYSQMDFGRGAGKGRPPSPMWFSAYGNYAFNRVPVFLEKADWTFPNDVDYVGIPQPGSPEYTSRTMVTSRSPSSGQYTWLPMKFEVSSISLVVQHTPNYWLDWSLDDYRSGKMLSDRGGFHRRPQ